MATEDTFSKLQEALVARNWTISGPYNSRPPSQEIPPPEETKGSQKAMRERWPELSFKLIPSYLQTV